MARRRVDADDKLDVVEPPRERLDEDAARAERRAPSAAAGGAKLDQKRELIKAGVGKNRRRLLATRPLALRSRRASLSAKRLWRRLALLRFGTRGLRQRRPRHLHGDCVHDAPSFQGERAGRRELQPVRVSGEGSFRGRATKRAFIRARAGTRGTTPRICPSGSSTTKRSTTGPRCPSRRSSRSR